MTVNVMLDLETWGCTPGSDIRSIGAVVFDFESGRLPHEFYMATENRYWDDGGYCASGGWMKWPLTRDSSTEEWWEKQSVSAQNAFENPVLLREALVHFSEWWHTFAGADARLWAHGPQFDVSILEACYQACEISVPWHYRAPRDTRTIWDFHNPDLPFDGTPHHALDDAKYQARKLILAVNHLGIEQQ